MTKARALRSSRVFLPEGERAATLLIQDGKIAEITERTVPETEDLGNLCLLPGIVDTHAHINEPGRTEWEGFETATRAAAAGGITTVVDMPLNSIPATTTLQALELKTRAAQGQCRIDYAFWGGVVPGNAPELEPMVRAGTPGFKCFLVESGVDEFPMSREEDLRQAMPILARLGVPLLVHAELEGVCPAAGGDPRAYRTYLDSRPQKWELDAVRLMIRLSRETGCRVHIVHLSAADALDAIRDAKREGVKITAETCPHYLAFCSEEIPDGATSYKCAPPIRERSNQDRLWQALKDGTIDFIVSDHSPCTPALKKQESGDFTQAWGGIAGLQFSFPVIWTEASQRGLDLNQVSRLMSAKTAEFAGFRNKGGLKIGADADLVVFDPDARMTLRPEMVRHRHPITPYLGREIRGQVLRTIVRGKNVFDRGDFPGSPSGENLR